jgi:hypothetical protein
MNFRRLLPEIRWQPRLSPVFRVSSLPPGHRRGTFRRTRHLVFAPWRPASPLRHGAGHPVWRPARATHASAHQTLQTDNRLFDLFPLRLQFRENLSHIHRNIPPGRLRLYFQPESRLQRSRSSDPRIHSDFPSNSLKLQGTNSNSSFHISTTDSTGNSSQYQMGEAAFRPSGFSSNSKTAVPGPLVQGPWQTRAGAPMPLKTVIFQPQ